ncbi:MAG: thermonuclease family protein [Gammaproteobacteria bacterium]|nr:thermonuclease family protein [Gammaproteobacteria bacterium]
MSGSSQVHQKASKWTLFVFIALSICLPAKVSADTCAAQLFHETVNVSHIYDGDTIRLTDGRKLRLIGINTPERGRDGNKDQPFYLSAKKQLQQIVKNNKNQLKIVLGKEKNDRYKRLLAHVFTINGKNISATLLRNGQGFSITIPPNIRFLNCYKNAEKEAQNNKRGIWNHAFSKPIRASSISNSTLGFQRASGTVKRIGKSRSSFWLNLDANFAIRILKKDLPYFNSVHPKTLLHHHLTVRGWVYKKNKEFRMTVHHPASLQIHATD